MTAGPQRPERPHDAARYDEEYRALEASLREYLDERLTHLEAGDDMQAPKTESRLPWRVDLYFAVTVLLLALIWWRLETRAPADPPAPETSAVEVSAPPAEPESAGGEATAEEPPVDDTPSGEASADPPTEEDDGAELPAVVPEPGSSGP